MQWQDQGTVANQRYTVVPRSLVFLVHQGHVLLLRGAGGKRLWAGKLNGVGGHLEPNEHPLEGARREVLEETGLDVADLRLRGLVHVAGVGPAPGVLLFVFAGWPSSRETRPSAEGDLRWYPLGGWPGDELVEDLPELLPRILQADDGRLVYGHYQLDPVTQRMTFRFD